VTEREMALPGRLSEDDAGATAADDATAAAGATAGDVGSVPFEPEMEGGLPGEALTEAQLEALLFVAERPLARKELAAATGASEATINDRLGDLEVSLAGRGVRLLLDRERVSLATAPEAGRLIGRYIGREPSRLSQATLETLAIVAYRQPVTKSAVERIRGVDAEYALRSLLHRRLVVELGRSDAAGRPILYGTGVDFLERFGLTSIDDLPVVEPDIAQRLAAPEADAADRAPRSGGA
jgi:segregation and condensation protein B